VGTAILSRNSERRAAEDHRTIRREFALLQDAHEMLHNSLREIAAGVHELMLRSEQEGTTALRAMANEGSITIKKASDGTRAGHAGWQEHFAKQGPSPRRRGGLGRLR